MPFKPGLDCAPRGGFSNLELALALGLVAVISLLLMVQQGEISFSFGSGGKPGKSAAQAGGKTGKQPEIFLPTTDPLRETAQRWVAQQLTDKTKASHREREARQALAAMDPKAAARLLEQMTPEAAAAALVGLHERPLAHILEQAEPAVAAQWISELLKLPQVPEIPEEFKSAAAAAGLYDATADELAAARGQEDTAATGAEGTSGTSEPAAEAPGTASGSEVTTPPADAGSTDETTPPAEGTTPTAGDTGTTDGALVTYRFPPWRDAGNFSSA